MVKEPVFSSMWPLRVTTGGSGLLIRRLLTIPVPLMPGPLRGPTSAKGFLFRWGQANKLFLSLLVDTLYTKRTKEIWLVIFPISGFPWSLISSLCPAATQRHQGVWHQMAHNLVRDFWNQFRRGPISQPERKALASLLYSIIFSFSYRSQGCHGNKKNKINRMKPASSLSKSDCGRTKVEETVHLWSTGVQWGLQFETWQKGHY